MPPQSLGVYFGIFGLIFFATAVSFAIAKFMVLGRDGVVGLFAAPEAP